MQQLLKLTVLFILLSGCNTYKTKYPYSLDDFRPDLRKHLEQIIYQTPFGYIGDSAANYIDNHTSEKELRKLLKSEHPILRSVAFEFLSLRQGVDCGNLLLENLDDTALILYNADLKMTVADYHITVSKGHTTIQKSDLIENVINKHRNLYYAGWFFHLESIKDEKYYVALKEIIAAQYPLHVTIRNDLISRLSQYQKNEDTSFISNELSRNWQSENNSKFALIENNPIDEYFFVIENFYSLLNDYNNKKILQEQFWQEPYLESTFKKFISATASFKSKRSSEILKNILLRKLYKQYFTGNAKDLRFHYELSESIKKYNCKYYESIPPLIEPYVKRYLKSYLLATPTDLYKYSDIIEKRTTW